MREETSVEVSELRSERNNAVAHHHELLASIRCVVRARKDLKDKAAGTLMRLRKIHDDGRKDTVETHVAEWSDRRERVASLRNDLQRKSLELQSMPSLVTEASQH